MKINVTNALQLRQPPRPGKNNPHQIGASEIGGCPRLLVHRRGNPENTDSWIGKAARGHVLEPECIALAEVILGNQGWTVARTQGDNCIEYVDGPVTAHPDFLAYKNDQMVVCDIKTATQGVFRKIRQGKVPSYHQDQILAQIGSARAEGEPCNEGTLWYFQADDLSECEMVTIPWDETAYAALRQKAVDAQTAIIFGMLAKGELGYQCDKCPIRDGCPTWKHDQPKEQGDFVVELRLKTILEELQELDSPKTDEDRAKDKRIETLKAELKDLLPKEGFDTETASVKWKDRAGSFDSVKFSQDYPDLAAQYRKSASRFPSITWKV